MVKKELTRRAFLGAAGTTLAAPALCLAQGKRQPNLIVIVTDDQGIGDVGCYGHPEVQTPHLDALAKRGVRFTNWYSNSPVCSPSRASLLTGQYPEKHGLLDVLASTAQFNTPGLKPQQPTLANCLKGVGYQTAHFGKWHVGSAAHSRPNAVGFDHFFGFYSGWTDSLSHRYYTLGRGQSEILHDLWRNGEEVWRDTEYQTELLGREAMDWIRQQKVGKPFYANLWFGAPHYPMMAPEKYLARYPKSMDRDRRLHLAMVSAVDDQVGVLVKQLEKQRLLDSTVIFFQSDNGATSETRADHAGRSYRGGSNAPYRGFKQGLFEGGIRMPAMLSWPEKVKPRVENGLGAGLDLMPTFLNWAGAKVPDGIDGVNQTSMILDGKASGRDDLHWIYQDSRAVRKGPWKLIENPPKFPGDEFGEVKDKLWLSNLDTDPQERKNWAGERAEVVAQLRPLLPRA